MCRLSLLFFFLTSYAPPDPASTPPAPLPPCPSPTRMLDSSQERWKELITNTRLAWGWCIKWRMCSFEKQITIQVTVCCYGVLKQGAFYSSVFPPLPHSCSITRRLCSFASCVLYPSILPITYWCPLSLLQARVFSWPHPEVSISYYKDTLYVRAYYGSVHKGISKWTEPA